MKTFPGANAAQFDIGDLVVLADGRTGHVHGRIFGIAPGGQARVEEYKITLTTGLRMAVRPPQLLAPVFARGAA